MTITRRNLLAQATSAIAVGSSTSLRAMPKPRFSPPRWYNQAIVIDGLSSFSDPYSPDEQTRLSERVKAELRTTGTTAVNVTIGSVGNEPDAWDQTLSSLKSFEAAIAANPDFLLRILTATDISAAKAHGRFGLIYGTQDTSMVGTKLDRLAEMRKLGVRIVQLTYNLRNLSGDGAL